jgi:prevent-host-death family protein
MATGGYNRPVKHVSIKEAKDRLPALAREAEAGERIVITRNGKPVAELGPHRKSGGIDWEGLRRYKEEHGLPQIVAEIPDDFDDPLPEDFLIRPLP